MKDIFQVDDFVKLPIEVKTNARTSYEYGKIDRISKDGQVVDLYLVDESVVHFLEIKVVQWTLDIFETLTCNMCVNFSRLA